MLRQPRGIAPIQSYQTVTEAAALRTHHLPMWGRRQTAVIVDHSRIEVSAADHTVYLDGVVPDRFAMNEAVGTAYMAPGVRQVVSRLVVAP